MNKRSSLFWLELQQKIFIASSEDSGGRNLQRYPNFLIENVFFFFFKKNKFLKNLQIYWPTCATTIIHHVYSEHNSTQHFDTQHNKKTQNSVSLC
jgi:hypothetical protein